MAYSEATMEGDPVVSRDGAEMVIAWQSSSPGGTWFQVYLNRRLALWTQARSARFPWPRDTTHIDVGTVLEGETTTDFSGSLAVIPLDRVRLEWEGGDWQGEDLAGFLVYQSLPNASVVLANPVADIPRTVQGVDLSGWGIGGWDLGGWGTSAGKYSWTSGRLANGDYEFAVQPYDHAGNKQGSPSIATATIAAPPRPPAAGPDGVRLRYSLDGSNQPTLTWLASPP